MKMTITKQFQNFLGGLGLNLSAIMEELGCPDQSWREDFDLSELDFHGLLRILDRELADEQIIQMSDIQNIQMFMPPFFAALSSQNGLAAIKHFAKYKKITGPIIVGIDEFEDLVRVRFRFDYPDHDLPRFSTINEQLLLLSMIRTGTGEAILPVQVSSPFDYSPAVVEVLGVEPILAEDNELIFHRSDLERPFLTANNLMLEYMEPQLKQRLADISHEKNFTNKVEEKLFKMIPSGVFSVEDVAAQLGLSSRTLQRHLKVEDTSFKQVLQGVQKLMAIQYVADASLSFDEIAYLVGYAEVSSFSRAFKKWTGKTLGQYRKAL